ncbi:uncharacterized protein LOC108600263 isoform X3 [Drosophila busckii]|uniref:uncharacterized protein LOC108600263 isoform X3 n=1 Tax=Drosophila busckii TaxID=30019 RepID=UPI00083EC5EA|nr:uncharacterized protein LOC108600263 isoform X3 [Drosophila busckii]
MSTTISVPQPTPPEEFLVVCILGKGEEEAVEDEGNTNANRNDYDNEASLVGVCVGNADSGRASANEFTEDTNAIGNGSLQVNQDTDTEQQHGEHNKSPAAVPSPTKARTGTKETVSQTKWYLESSEQDVTVTTITSVCKDNSVTVTATTSSDLTQIMPKNSKDGPAVIGTRANGYGECLSQQMRAISSPALTDNTEAAAQQPQTKFVAPTDETAKNADGNCNASTSGTAESLSVFQKFKRNFHNLNNKNQLHINSTPTTTTAVAATAASPATETKASPTTPTVCITAPAAASTSAETNNDECNGGDSTSGRYRFGPLIWRTSKERRKTKFNRRDKCNSGDSGIQIEIEQDEQYVRGLSNEQQGAAGAAVTSTPKSVFKPRSIRRTHSAKSSNVLAATGGNAGKPPVYRQHQLTRACCTEREAPESLPTRSLSQPNGLDNYGMRRSVMEDSDSDSVASHEEGSSYYPIYAEVLYNFTAAGPQELGLERGTLIEILRKEVGPWWFGRIKKDDASLFEEILDPELGWFPKDFIRIIHSPETDAFYNLHKTSASEVPEAATAPADSEVPVIVTELNSSIEEADTTMTMDQSNITTIVIESPPATVDEQTSEITALHPSSATLISVPVNSAELLRRSAVRELLETEVNYVKLLASICDGYLPAMSKRIDIFSPNSIRLIFSNITSIYKFQKRFLEALRKGIEQNQLSKVFLKMHKGFLCYSTYCNAYPRALIELESYDRVKDARTVLENCRESENLAELPLSAHLLAPVQRICRYPLHLNEIIKSTSKSASMEATPATNSDEPDGNGLSNVEYQDYDQLDVGQLDVPDTLESVHQALDKMRGITEAVNEGKRHSETIARHQSSFQNFKGPPLHLHSTRFFLQVDATRQKQNLWNSSYTLFLFDNQLVYCKRDIIKRSHFIYKGRIFLDRCRVVNVRDGKMFGHTIKNSLRIYCESRDKWYDFSFRSANRKHRFLNTLALERQFGGKALYVSEMTGFEYNFDERTGDYSDQSDYELPECDHALGTTSASGDSSVPESPAKSPYRSCDTLPKKSQSRDGLASSSNASGSGSVSGSGQILTTTSTGSLGRRRLGNWFRKPKSTNCTPSQSPTHKSGFDADVTLTAARVAAIELVEAAAAEQEVDSSYA